MIKESNLLPATSQTSRQPASGSEQDPPSISWPTMSIERYAAFEQSLGAKVLRTGDIWWIQIRPFFYRPLLPFMRYDSEQVKGLVGNRGVFQHAVMESQPHNSYLNPIIFDDLRSYDHRLLRKNVRGSLRKAMASGATVRRIIDEAEFCEKAYPTYLSFYERTKYSYAEGRRERTEFSRWAHALFQFRDSVILGVFAEGELVAFALTFLVDKTLIIKMVVTSDTALKFEASDLLLHHCRTSAVGRTDIDLISYGMLCSNTSLNRYKTRRGARVLALPSLTHINPILLWSIKKTSRKVYSKLYGLDANALRVNDLMPRLSDASVAD